MQYHHVAYEQLEKFCREVFKGYHFTDEESRQITDVLLAADLSGIESHGIQRLIRYHQEITGGLVKLDAKPEVVFETPLSAVIEGNDCMGQLLGVKAMEMAIAKAKEHGFGMITVRNSNHYGIAGYYAKMAVKEDMIGMCMTNTEAIMVPTFGRQAMLGTNPIAFAMPADPVPFSFDAATTVVPRGKLEVYVKRGNGLPEGWALDETGHDSTDPERVLKNIIAKAGGGILPLGGSGEKTSGYKGYGFAMLCEICTAILSGGTTSNYIYKTPGRANIAQCFLALDYGMFGDKKAIRDALDTYLQEVRDSAKAEGQERIYIHGEKSAEARARVLHEGVSLNEKTYDEMKMIGAYTGAQAYLPAYQD
ncbi:Ldh family oxidoreductase [Oscillibacter sp.]|uniref:Ldh family oxidoreductase n=1 Tax=Oscillibacter sp. TaxID=1945593 RepID=UPI002628A142|nr:Ldh family oxidoreductase [Oscillibacter sp.]MDD3347650.1 Ldh family oxidoreductase [Oscillibacter sp.]